MRRQDTIRLEVLRTFVRMPRIPSDQRSRIRKLHGEGLSYREIGNRLGVSKSTVAYHVRRLGVPAQDRCARRYDWSEVQRAVDEGASVSELVKRFGFARASYAQAVKRGAIVPRRWVTPMADLLVAGQKRNGNHVKGRLVREGLKEACCEICGIDEWQGKPLSMELHHINGDATDNRLENLQLLCANCHSQTENWGGRALLRGTASGT